jgi:hypothetical protein
MGWPIIHNLVVSALASENRRSSLSVVDIDAVMRRQCTHVTSQACRGDILVRSVDQEMTDRTQGHCCFRRQFVLDVQTVAMVDGNWVLEERWNSVTNKHENPGCQRSIASTKLNMHKLDTAWWLFCALALVPWDHLLSAIYGYWLC